MYKPYYQSCYLDFFYKKNKKVFSIKIYRISKILDIKKQLEIWRKQGLMDKPHNIITFL